METELLNTVVKQNKTVANATDPYNIFSVLSIETKEVLICRVIGDFLNPDDVAVPVNSWIRQS